jgi:hypothetical protein
MTNKKYRKYARQELGNFCEQFGYSLIKTIALSRQRRKQQKIYKTRKYKKTTNKIRNINLINFRLETTRINLINPITKITRNNIIKNLFVTNVEKLVITKV